MTDRGWGVLHCTPDVRKDPFVSWVHLKTSGHVSQWVLEAGEEVSLRLNSLFVLFYVSEIGFNQ